MPNTNPAKMKNPPQSPALSGFQPQNHPLDSTKTHKNKQTQALRRNLENEGSPSVLSHGAQQPGRDTSSSPTSSSGTGRETGEDESIKLGETLPDWAPCSSSGWLDVLHRQNQRACTIQAQRNRSGLRR